MRVAPFATQRTPGTLDYRDMLSIEYRGSIGRGAGLGRLRCGGANLGDRRRISGTFQRRKLSVDKGRYNNSDNLRYPVIAMRTYRPTYSNTEIQEENRLKFAQAVAYWQGLDDEAKAEYDRIGDKRRMSGFNVAISHFMLYYTDAP